MKANELRIGNLVYRQKYLLEKHFKGLEKYNLIKVDCNDITACSISPDKFKSIPLTEEILLKCGFEKDTDGSFVKGFVSLFLDKRFRNNIFLKENNTEKWIGINCKIKHLHQLQNLYFALTGEELNIEL